MAAEIEKNIESDQVSGSPISNLPDVVASMEMLTVASEISTSGNNTQRRYELRKRIPKIETKESSSEVLNRRCSLKPRKNRGFSSMKNDGEIEKYYLDKNIKKISNTKLETIYEEINGISETSTVISGRSFNRLIKFNNDKRTIDAKIKKRKAKIKRVFGSKFKSRSGNVTMHALVKKLNGIRSETQSSQD